MRASMVWLLVLTGHACVGSSRNDAPPRQGSDSSAPPAIAASSVAASQGPILVGTTWRLAEVDGKPMALGQDGKAATMELTIEGKRVSGFAGCNRMSGTYRLQGDSLRFGPLALTRMACKKGMDIEREFVAALEGTRAYRLSPDGLELLGESGTIARLEAQ